MSLSRRRFLTLSAAAVAVPAHAITPTRWTGFALGAEVSMTLHAPRELAAQAIAQSVNALREIERQFSIYDPASSLSNLNNAGYLSDPNADFLDLVQISDEVHRLTAGRFDPSIQTLWDGIATGMDPLTRSDLVGWDRIAISPARITLAPGQKLSFNGIAQGFATDKIAAILADLGLTQTLINIGEHRAIGGPFRLGLEDPSHGHLGTRHLKNGAIATSSPGAMRLGGRSHIMHPRHTPQWSTVSVEARTAALADGLSTALCLAGLDLVREIRAHRHVRQITLVDEGGDLITL